MARSGRYVNYQVQIKDGSGSLTTFKEITGVSIQRGTKLLAAYGDAKIFPTMQVAVESHRSITLMGADVSKLLQLPAFDTYEVSVILLDAASWNQTTPTTASGAATVQLNPCKIAQDNHDAKNNEYAGTTITFQGYSTDGTTDPLTISEAA